MTPHPFAEYLPVTPYLPVWCVRHFPHDPKCEKQNRHADEAPNDYLFPTHSDGLGVEIESSRLHSSLSSRLFKARSAFA